MLDPIRLKGLAILVVAAAGLLLASQPLLAAPTTQQHPNSPEAKHPQQHQDNCYDEIENVSNSQASKFHIEPDGLYSKGIYSKINPKELVNVLTCPVLRAIIIKPDCEHDICAQKHAENISSHVTVRAWYKDRKLHHRYNGNFFVKQIDSPTQLALLEITEADAGTYKCVLDYSRVNTSYHDYAKRCLLLYPSIEFGVDLDDSSFTFPDIPPQITHPPYPQRAERGEKVTFTCTHIDTLLSQRVDWFRSGCNISEVKTYDACMVEFFNAYNKTSLDDPTLDYMQPYFIDGEDGDTFTIGDVDEDDVDTYGCIVSNNNGLDIRIANLTMDHPINGVRPRASPVQEHKYLNESWVASTISVMIVVAFIIVTLCLLCCTKAGLKISMRSPLLKQMVVEESTKEESNRQHLPKVESPDIYNIGKSDECYIYGHFQQKNGHLMAQSMCNPNLIMEKNLSISSNNYHSDESSSLGKSLSSSGDNSRAFYQHTSNNTATTVPLYDHPLSTGTTQLSGALVQGLCVINPTYGFLRPDFDATSPKWTFSRRNLEPQKMIGKGQFGEVWRYVAHQKDGTASYVAVKKLTVRSGQEQQAKDEILKEIEIMKRVNDHPNVIKFLNTCMEPTTVLLIMEYADNGTLQAYLRKCRYAKDEDGSSITSKELLKYSYHVAKGMEYIASKGIVHRDLATRNILLSKEKTCKIADFGLARFVGESGIYQRLDRNQPVPIKWMAPESLSEYGTYTSKSDVFSVGVLMWEVVTLGATPYDFLPSSEVLKKVVSGGRLSRPEHCKEEFYNIMDRCWHQNPDERPAFKELADDLEVLLQSENDYIQLDKYPEHAYYNINMSKNAEKEMVTALPFYPELENVFDQC